jgi:hypothetical protein
MTAATDALNGAFRLDLKLRGLQAATRLVIDQDADTVRVHVVLPEPRHVRAWAKQMGVEAETGEPTRNGGTTWWYRHTVAAIRRDGLDIRVSSTAMALDLDAASMTEPVPA